MTQGLDSKAINRAIKHVLWDCTQVHGFNVTAARACWRRRTLGVDNVEIQGSKWNAYDSGRPLGFYVNVGIALDAIPPMVPVPPASPAARPDHASCHFRWRLKPVPAAGKDASLWVVAPDGSDFVAVFHEIASAFEERALPWFSRFRDLEDLLDLMLSPSAREFPSIFAVGADASPAGQRMVAYLALSTGRRAIAIEYFEKALSHEAWLAASPWLAAQLEDGLARARTLK